MVSTTTVRKPATIETARAIFARGTDCLGPEEVMRVHGELHGLKLPKKLPCIPWTEDELKAARARDEGAHIVLIPPGLTMQAICICDKRQNLGTDGGNLLFNTDWYKDEKFFITDTTGAKWDWRLVTNEVIPGSTGQNYVEQTATLAEYLTNVVFADRELPFVYRRAVNEFRAKQDELTRLTQSDSDWKEGAKQLSKLTLNRLLRGTPVFTLYDWVTYLAVNSERLVQGMYHWTCVLSSYGRLVRVAYFARLGAHVNAWNPLHRNVALGVVFSRSAEVESGR